MERDCEGLIVIERRCNEEIPTMKPKGVQKAEKAEEAPSDFECACFTCPSQEACKAAQAAPREETER